MQTENGFSAFQKIMCEQCDGDIQKSYIENVFNLFQVKNYDKFKVIIQPVDHGIFTLTIFAKDCAFIVDSILNELKKLGITKLYMSIPVLNVSRNNDGNLLNFFHVKESDNPNNEAISFFLLKAQQEIDLNALQIRLDEILHCVFVVNESWGESKQIMHKVIGELNTQSKEKHFLEWMLNNNFIFLGAYALSSSTKLIGIVDTESYQLSDFTHTNVISSIRDSEIVFRRTTVLSVVHRNANMDVIYVKNQGTVFAFVGFFTSAVYHQNVMGIPIVAKKLQSAIQQLNHLQENGYVMKELMAELQNYPRAELFQMSISELCDLMHCIISVILMPRVKIFIRNDITSDFKSVLIFIPREKFSMDLHSQIEEIVYERMCVTPLKKYIHISERQLMNIHLIVRNSQNKEYDLHSIETAIESITWNWKDLLIDGLRKRYSQAIAESKILTFCNAFNNEYIDTSTFQEAIADIENIDELNASNKTRLCRFMPSDSGYHFRIYSKNERIEVSDLIPAIENAGFSVIDMMNYAVHPAYNGISNIIYIHSLDVRPKYIVKAENAFLKDNLENLMDRIIANDDHDRFNSLILCAGISRQEVIIYRAYSCYLKQLGVQFDKENAIDALIANSQITQHIVKLFNCKFAHLNSSREDLIRSYDQIKVEIISGLSSVESAVHDRILRCYLAVIDATKRTNFFSDKCVASNFEYISFKIASNEIAFAPLPRPFMEIFVYSNRFEGIHLRGGKVARGGIRWSDRHLDYRTEVLGLMKAQMTKNSVIVPVGSKGGFVVKSVNPKDRDAFMQEGIECYKMFLRGLLDITDNFEGAKVISTQNSVCWDEADPYLVVAADKGTATFSDYANALAIEYNFWLGDAFASGGSAGYDHKVLGITSRGAWISVKQHFKMLGIDPNEQEITVIGIGDMSGDVFGNGLLMSNKIKLVAAFNHMHIFIDPNPNTAQSFIERKRLFEKPRSQWSDYDTNIISKGGGVFSRNSKLIELTSEMKQILDIQESIQSISPDELIQVILKAPVDLLWNGGIGTYVKSSKETNEQIGDKANDNLRINGQDLRCKVVGEGGNLGFTQLGRVEYAAKSGCINTDAIDNSGGVDCSDHEVNLKIAFSRMLADGKMSLAERNDLLASMSNEVCELVLQDNRLQTQILSIETSQGHEKIWEHEWLVNHLEEAGELNRDVEKLPIKEDFMKMIHDGQSLTKPEICVLLAYAKNSAIRMLEAETGIEKLFENAPYRDLYLNYFPKILRNNEKYLHYLMQHRLKNQILVTVIVNDLINTMGCTYFHLMIVKHGITPINLIKAFCIVKYGLEIDSSWKMIENMKITGNAQSQLFKMLQVMMSRNVSWICHGEIGNFDLHTELYDKLADNVRELIMKCDSNALSSQMVNMIKEMLNINDLPTDIFNLLQRVNLQFFTLDIFLASERNQINIHKLSKTYHELRKKMKFDDITLNIASVFFSLQYESKSGVMIVLRSLEALLLKIAVSCTGIAYDIDAIIQESKYLAFFDEDWSNNDIVSSLLLLKIRLKTVVSNLIK